MTRAKEMRDLPLALDADSNGNLTISGPTTIANDASYYADTLAAVNSSSMALNISPTRASVTKAITLGAMGTTNAGTGIQAYDTSDNSANPFYINPFGGKVGIGSTYGPPYPLTVVGSNVSAGGGLATLGVVDNGTAYNATPGGGITFRGIYHSANLIGDFGVIRGIKENATHADFASALTFHTRENGGMLQERFRISSNGNVGIGTTGPLAQLEIDPPAVDTPIFAIRRQDHASVPLFKFFQDSSVAQGTGHAHMNTGNRDLSITADANSTKTLGIYLMTTGNVGIGTTSPGFPLHVVGGTRFAGSNNDVHGQVSVHGTSGGDAQVVFVTDSNGRGIYVDESDVNKMKFYTGYGKGVSGKEIVMDNNANMGIGTTSPADPLDVLGADSGIIVRSAAANRPHIKLINGTSTMLALSANGSLAYIGDGNSLNRYMSFAGGNVNILGNLYYGGQLYVGGGYYIVASSDDVLKVRTGNIPDALNKISQINGFYYTDSDQVTDLIKGVDEENNQTYHEKTTEQKIGVSAQELQKVLPEVVEDMNTKMSKTQTVYKGVNYGKIVPLLIEGIKELKTTVETLEARIKTLES